MQEGKQMLSPIIKLDSVFLREVATGQLRTVVSQIYRVTSVLRSITFNLPIAFFFRSKGLLCDFYLGQRCSDLWACGSVCWREENVGVREKYTVQTCLFQMVNHRMDCNRNCVCSQLDWGDKNSSGWSEKEWSTHEVDTASWKWRSSLQSLRVCISMCNCVYIFIACQSSPISKYLISFVIFSPSGWVPLWAQQRMGVWKAAVVRSQCFISWALNQIIQVCYCYTLL